MTEEKSQAKNSKKQKSMLQRFISTSVTAFFLGFLVLVIFNAYEWKTTDYKNMMQNLNNNQEKIISSLSMQNMDFAAYSVAVFQVINDEFKQWFLGSAKDFQAWQKNNRFGFFLHSENKEPKNSNFIGDMVSGSFGFLQKVCCMLWMSLGVLIFKFISIFGAFLIYLFASLLGALDGLVKRYIRTAEGGRESTFVFHKMTSVIIQFPLWLIIIYLISPMLINPMLVISLLALAFFVVFNIATSNLKKFL